MTVEYTKARTAVIVERYVAAVEDGLDYDARTALVAELADELSGEAKVDVTEGSVRSKLVSEGVYVGKTKVKTADTGTTKDAYVKALSAIVGKDVKSFEKATKADLKAVVDYITTASAVKAADEGVDEVAELQTQVANDEVESV